MSVTVTIAAVDQTARLYFATQAGFTLPLNGQRGSSRFRLQSLAGDSYTPSEGQKVIWNDNGITAFEGTVDSIDVTPIADGDGFWFDITCVSLEQILDKLFVTRSFIAAGSPVTLVTAGAIVTSVMNTEAAAELITLGTIASGVTFDKPKFYDHVRITDVFNDLCQLSGDYIFYIQDGALNFGPRTTVAAPFGITDNTGDLLIVQPSDVLYSRVDYRNRQTIKIGEQNLSANVESFPGDGSKTTFTLSQPIRDVVSITRTTATTPSSGPATGTFTGVPAIDDTITIAGQKYTFRDPTAASFNDGVVSFFLGFSVAIGVDAATSCANLVAAINGAAGAGTLYGSAPLAPNPYVTASASGAVITVTPSVPGVLSAFFVGLNTTCSVFSWAAYNASTATDGSSVPQSFAEVSNPSAARAQWLYFAGGVTIDQQIGETPLGTDEILVVTYHPIGFGFVTVQNSAEISARAAIEGGSGIYENLTQRLDLLTIEDGITAAQALLDSYDFIARTVTFLIDHTGLRPGQILSLTSTRLNVSGSFLVQSVSALTKGPLSAMGLRYTIVAVAIAP